MPKRKVYIVGAGPGDPELITLKAVRAIKEADIILYDRLINDELLSYAKSTATLIFAGKEPNHHTMTQEEINDALIQYAKQGNIVTRLKGGDPFVYGRGSEEADCLFQQNIPFEIIPGITAGIAAPTYAGIPVTHRNISNSFTVITGHALTKEDTKWQLFTSRSHTLIIYMGMKNLPNITEQLIKNNMDSSTPIAVIEWGTTLKQRVITGTLQTIVTKVKKHQMKNPAIIVIGEVVTFHPSLQWTNNKINQEHHIEI